MVGGYVRPMKLVKIVALTSVLMLTSTVFAYADWQKDGDTAVIFDGTPTPEGGAGQGLTGNINTGEIGVTAGAISEDGNPSGSTSISGTVRVTYIWVGSGPAMSLPYLEYLTKAYGTVKIGAAVSGNGSGSADSSSGGSSGSTTGPKDSYNQSGYDLPSVTPVNPVKFYADTHVSANCSISCPTPVFIDGEAGGAGTVTP